MKDFLVLVADWSDQTYIPSEATEDQAAQTKKVLLWDRKTEGGFPGTCLP